MIEQESPPEFMNDTDIAVLCRVPVKRVRNWARRGKLPPCLRPPGTTLRLYERRAVLAWLGKKQ